MHYMGTGVMCTEDGFPLCHMDDKLCDINRCRYFIPISEIGNCVLRTDEHVARTFGDLSEVLGVSRQRVDQIEKRALEKLRTKFGKQLREEMNR